MRILVLGGTRFLGRAVVDAAAGRGWSVTVFNRGTSGPAPAGVEAVRGDRRNAADLARLAGHGPWDAVVDVPGVIPAEVRDAARALAPVSGAYVFVSSVSAYRGWPAEPVNESSPLHEGDPDLDVATWEWGAGVYGRYKAGAETAVQRETGGRALIVRPGVILGPWEYSGRLTWWLRRIAAGGRFIAPGDPAAAIQPVDVRDVATFVLDRAAGGKSGVYNLAGPTNRDTFGAFIDACLHVTGSTGTPVWMPDDRLKEAGVKEWTALPLWRTGRGTWQVDPASALTAGFAPRPLNATVRDTWTWMQTGDEPFDDPRAKLHGIPVEVEHALLAAPAERRTP